MQIYYEELLTAIHQMPDTAKVMEMLNRTYRRFLDAQTCRLSISLVGPFAQTDYLLKEHKGSRSLRREINDARVRLKRSAQREACQSELCYVTLFALTHFFALVTQEEAPDELTTIEREWKAKQEKFGTQDVKPKTSASSEQEGRTDVQQQCLSRTHAGLQSLRFLIDSWDEQYMYGRIDAKDGSVDAQIPGIDVLDDSLDITFRVDYAKRFAYLRPMLSANAQFNLIRPRIQGDVIQVDYLILEPDYLVNITSVARCFQNYDESPYVHLLSRLTPSANSEAIILGNFAGQLLDEQLHTGDETPYKESVTTFFHNQINSLLTVPLSEKFHEEAKKQRDNIHRTVCDVLPAEVSAFKKEKVLLEPSFFSEMLGLSGRMDLLQQDMKVLVEQKSGKAAFVAGDAEPNIPKPAETHYVQMLLYMLLVRYNYPEYYYQDVEGIQAFLLYSSGLYNQNLVKLDFAPDLVHRALRLRNGIAWMDNQLGNSHTALSASHWSWRKLLMPLTPDILNTKGCKKRIWTDFQRPQIEAILNPIHQASSLERAYFFRFMDFLSREHLLSKVGNKSRQNTGFASAWHNSLAEKRQSGVIFDQLELESVSPLTLRFTDSDCHDVANFRVGDIVVLYSYPKGTLPDLRRTMVHRVSIEEITADRLVLKLRAEQTDPQVFLSHINDNWAIEHDMMESSFDGLYRGMHAFLTAPQERKDLLLLQRLPRIDETLMIKGEYGDFNAMMQHVKQAQDFFLIIGPPGTGKTSFGMLNTLKEELLENGEGGRQASRVLVLSYTNRAVDEICSKLFEEGIDFLRLGKESSCAKEYRSHLLSTRAAECRGLQQVKDIFMQARVICATTTTASSHLDMLRLKGFSLCIIDEASQILEPHLMALLSATYGSEKALLIPKFVMIGDHKQLPAVVQQSVEDAAVRPHDDMPAEDAKLLNDIGLTNCRLSLFERLLMRYRHDEKIVYMLTRQGRMHHDIADFPNQAFYLGNLTEVPLPHQLAENPIVRKQASDKEMSLRERLFAQRVTFVDVPAPHGSISDKVNQAEAELIADAVLEIYTMESDNFDVERTIGIIVPYRNQIATVRNTIARKVEKIQKELSSEGGVLSEKDIAKLLSSIAIDTVERFQGSQRRYIIYGFTIQQPYQLDFLTDNTFEEDGHLIDRKLNVAMTRAQEHLLVVGNKDLLERVPLFKDFIQRYEV